MARQSCAPDANATSHPPSPGGRRRFPILSLGTVLAWLMVGPAHVSRSESTAPRRYVIKVWQGEKGLPQNTITGIAQTADGYLWITTLDGVARFDGVNFIIFKAGDTPTLGSGRIRFLFTGPRDTLWFSTQEGGVIKLEKGRFTPPDQPQKLNTMEKAWAYPVVADGKLYIRDNNVLWCYAVGSVK